jgi:hypothetical protein
MRVLTLPPPTGPTMSRLGHERRPLQQAAARRLPLWPVSDQGRVAMKGPQGNI